MKRLICSMLIIAIIASFSVQALAYTEEKSKNPAVTDSITLYSTGHGQYTPVQPGSSSSNTVESSLSTVTAYATEDKEIYHIFGNQYLAEVADNLYLMMSRIDLNPTNGAVNDKLFQTYHVDASTQQEITQMIAEQNANGNQNFAVSIFLPASTAENDTVTYPRDRYYTYHGNSMKDSFIKYTNPSVSTGEITGTNVKTLMGALKNLVVAAAGTTLEPIALFGIYDSALALYQASKGTVSYGSTSDKTYTNITYDKLVKKTYVGLQGSFLLGCQSQKVWYNTNYTYQYYAATGKSLYSENYLNQIRYTESFCNAAYVALHNMDSGKFDGSIRATIHGVTCVF